MREIKFKRVFKNRNSGEISFMEWGNIDFRGQSVLDFSSFASPGTNSHSSPITDLQYTGLKDKNGKEVYEGDILRYEYYHPVGKQIYTNEVVWDEGKAAWSTEYMGGEYHHFGETIFCTACHVVGNIYEHPHLLSTLQGEEDNSLK